MIFIVIGSLSLAKLVLFAIHLSEAFGQLPVGTAQIHGPVENDGLISILTGHAGRSVPLQVATPTHFRAPAEVELVIEPEAAFRPGVGQAVRGDGGQPVVLGLI